MSTKTSLSDYLILTFRHALLFAKCGRQALLMNEIFVFFVCVLLIDLIFLKEGGLAPIQGEANKHLRKV